MYTLLTLKHYLGTLYMASQSAVSYHARVGLAYFHRAEGLDLKPSHFYEYHPLQPLPYEIYNMSTQYSRNLCH
jgi:hypothetical protein